MQVLCSFKTKKCDKLLLTAVVQKAVALIV